LNEPAEIQLKISRITKKDFSHFFAGAPPAAAAAFAAALSAIALASASFFCAGVIKDLSPGFGAAGTLFL
jgi:hypothetical protein